MKSKGTKFLSLLLALLMIISILPTSLFVYGDGGDDSKSQGGEGPNGETDGSWGNYRERNGLRCSLYFAEFDDETSQYINEHYENDIEEGIRWAEMNNKLQYDRIGDTVNLDTSDGNNLPNNFYFSNKNIYEYMAENQMDTFKFTKENYSDVLIDADNLVVEQRDGRTLSSWMNKFKNTIKEMFVKEGDRVDEKRWTKFFLQSDGIKNSEDWENAKLDYLMPIINEITKDVDGLTITEEDFKKGELNSGKGSKQGVYKFYYEPLWLRSEKVNGGSETYLLLSIRDSIVYGNKMNSKDKTYGGKWNGKKVQWEFLQSCNTMSKTVSRSTFITKPQPILNMNGANEINTNWSEYNDNSSDFYQAGGLGVIFGCPHDNIGTSLNRPKEIITYAMIDKVTLENNILKVTYKDAGVKPTMENVRFMTDAQGNVTNVPLIEDVKYGKTYTAYLNDVFTTKYKLGYSFRKSDKIEWLNTDLITGLAPYKEVGPNGRAVSFDGNLKATAEDISGYRFGIFVDNEVFIEQIVSVLNSKGEDVTGSVTTEVSTGDANAIIQNVLEEGRDDGAVIVDIDDGTNSGYIERIINLSGRKIGTHLSNDSFAANMDFSGSKIQHYKIQVNSATDYNFIIQSKKADGSYITYINFTPDSYNKLVSAALSRMLTPELFLSIFYDKMVTLGTIAGKNMNQVATVDNTLKEFINKAYTGGEQEYLAELSGLSSAKSCQFNYNQSTPPNTLVLRYLIVLKPVQINLIKVYEAKPDNTKTLKQVIVEEAKDLDITGNTVTIQKPDYVNDAAVSGPDIVRWVSNPEYPTIDMSETKELPTEKDLEGTTEDPIPNYPTDPVTDNLYVEWEVLVETPIPSQGKESVPQWRLSKYINSVVSKLDNPVTKSANMSLSLNSDNTSHVTSTLSPSGTYNFDVINPNGRVNDNSSTPNNMKMNTIDTSKPLGYGSVTANTYFHSAGIAKSSDSVSHGKPYANIKLDANLNSIKSDDNGKLIVANWIPASYGNLNSIGDYTIKGAALPVGYNTLDHYNKLADLFVNVYNRDTYDHEVARYYHWTSYCDEDCGGHDECGCFLYTQYISPSQAGYTGVRYALNVKFDRYIQSDTSNRKFTTTPEIKESNAKTSLKYQIDENLTIYPEYGMLLAKDNNDQEIKFVISDKARTLSPVVYQTLEHKVYVVPTVSGSSVATDTRGLTQYPDVFNNI